jgi:hypothetical protein
MPVACLGIAFLRQPPRTMPSLVAARSSFKAAGDVTSASWENRPSYVRGDSARQRPALSSSIQTMKIPTPISEEVPSGVRPRTLKIEPSAKIAAAIRPATPSQRQTRLVRWIANESAATRAVIVQTTGVRPCS